MRTFERLERRLGAPRAKLADCVRELVEQVNQHWPEHRDNLGANSVLVSSVDDSVVARSRSLLS